MKKTLFLFANLLLSTFIIAQAKNTALFSWVTNAATQTAFQKNATKIDALRNVYNVGATLNASNGMYDIFIQKLSSGGDILYTTIINGTGNDQDAATSIVIGSLNEIYVTGTITNSVSMVPELFLAKYNASGTQLFFSTYSNGYAAIGKDLMLNTTYNSCIVTGAAYNSSGNSDMVVVSFDMTSGTTNWNNGFDFMGLHDTGMKITTRGNGCTVSSAVTVGTNQYKLVTTSYTVSSGLGTGTITAGAVATSSVEIITDMVQDASGNTYLCGATQQNSGQGYDMYIAKITGALTIAYERTINGFSGSSLDDFAKGIKVNSLGEVFVTGVTNHATQGKNMTTLKLNSSGVVQWTVNENNNTFNGNDEGADVEIDVANNVYATGFKTIGVNNKDMYSVKYDANGNKIWEVTEQNSQNDAGTNIILNNNDVIIAGSRETAPSMFEYVTYKYVQKDVITPTDLNSELPSANFMYYPNSGQLKNTSGVSIPEVKFYTHNTFPSFLFKNNSQTLVFSKVDTIQSTIDTIQRVDFLFNYSNANAEIYPMEEQQNSQLNFFLAHVNKTGIKGNAKLITKNIYPNIDLMCSSNDQGIKYYFIVNPGGSPKSIQMEFIGATSYSLNSGTNALTINTIVGGFTYKKPIAYQLTALNSTIAVTGWNPDWQSNGASNKYIFNNGAYTNSLTLIIEVDQGLNVAKPLHLGGPEWSTPFGGTGYDEAFDIKTDVDGNSYWAGTTNASIPVYLLSPGTFPGFFGDFDVFVAKFGTAFQASALPNGDIPNGDKLLCSTYYGGTGEDKGYGLAVVGNSAGGDIYVTGSTKSGNLSTFSKSGFYNDSYAGNTDAFVLNLKYDANGMKNSSFVWSSYIGGTGDDVGKDIKVNGMQIFIGGSTTSAPSSNPCTVPNGAGDNGFPVCNSQFKNTQSGGIDGFIVNLNTTTGLTEATYIGGSGDDVINELSLNSGGQAYFVGTTNSSAATFSPVSLVSGFAPYNQNVIGGGADAFFGRMISTSKWLSYYGGSGDDNGNTITLTDNNKFVIGGLTKSAIAACNSCTCVVPSTVGDFPICPKLGSTTYTSYKGGGSDGFLAEFDISGTYTWGSYMGGDKDDYISSVSFGVDLPQGSFNQKRYLFFAGETNTMNRLTLYYDINNSNIYSLNAVPSAVPFVNASDGYFGVNYQDNVLLHTDYCIGLYYGNYNGPSITNFQTNCNKVHLAGGHYYFAGKTTNPNFMQRVGSGTDVTGAHGAYINSQSWPFNANQPLNPTGGLVNYNPDATMMRINLHSMPMINSIQDQKTIPSTNELLIFPNPTYDILNILYKASASDQITIEVINLLGQKVYSANLGLQTDVYTNINTANFAAGVYNISIIGNKTLANKLFVKQ